MSTLSEILFDTVRKAFSSVDLPPSSSFAPLYSLEVGELSSSAAVEIAKLTKQRAEGVAQVLVDLLAQKVPAQWRHDNGYIIASQIPMNCLLSELPDSFNLNKEAGSDTITRSIALLSDATEPLYARIRLLSRALVQALLTALYDRSVFVVIPELSLEPIEVLSKGEAIDLFRRATIAFLASGNSRSCDLVEFLKVVSLTSRPTNGVIWTSHRRLDSLSSSDRKRLFDLRGSARAQVLAPNDGWLLSRERSLSNILSAAAIERVVNRIEGAGRDGWQRFLFHCASLTPSGDFDPAVALFDEAASPLWNMRALVERYDSLIGSVRGLELPLDRTRLEDALSAFDGSVVVGKDLRHLILQGLFMPLYTSRAVVRSEVQVWCEAFEGLAKRGHLFLNAPATRLALIGAADKSGVKEESDRVYKIASGLGFGLSSIVGMV